MRIHTEKPACFDRLQKAFGISWESGIIITVGGKIHTISGHLAPDFLVHEMVHVKQQEGIDPDEWVERFINDKEFRLQVELEAYRAQADYCRKTITNKRILAKKLFTMHVSMARLYGGMISYTQARKLI